MMYIYINNRRLEICYIHFTLNWILIVSITLKPLFFWSKIHEMKFGFAWIILLMYNRKAWSNRGFYRMWPIEIWQQCLDSLVSPCHFLFFHAIKYSTYKSIERKIFAFRWYLNVYIWNSNLSFLENGEISRNIVQYFCCTMVYE